MKENLNFEYTVFTGIIDRRYIRTDARGNRLLGGLNQANSSAAAPPSQSDALQLPPPTVADDDLARPPAGFAPR